MTASVDFVEANLAGVKPFDRIGLLEVGMRQVDGVRAPTAAGQHVDTALTVVVLLYVEIP